MYTEFSSTLKPGIVTGRAPVYSNAHIEYWGEMYVALELKKRGILFETFLAYPHDILESVEMHSSIHDHLPLLPEQRQVQERVWADEIDQEAQAQFTKPLCKERRITVHLPESKVYPLFKNMVGDVKENTDE